MTGVLLSLLDGSDVATPVMRAAVLRSIHGGYVGQEGAGQGYSDQEREKRREGDSVAGGGADDGGYRYKEQASHKAHVGAGHQGSSFG